MGDAHYCEVLKFVDKTTVIKKKLSLSQYCDLHGSE